MSNLARIKKRAREVQARLSLQRALMLSSLTYSDFTIEQKQFFASTLEFETAPTSFIKSLIVTDTAVYLFLESEYEDVSWLLEDDYFYYLCDFPEHCRKLGVVFPDEKQVNSDRMENYGRCSKATY